MEAVEGPNANRDRDGKASRRGFHGARGRVSHRAKLWRGARDLKISGPRLLDADVDEAEIARRMRSRPDLEVGVALMTQSLISGIGNVYKSETCFACGVNPFRRVQSLSEAELACLISTSRKFLRANVSDTLRRSRSSPTPACDAPRAAQIHPSVSGFTAAQVSRAGNAATRIESRKQGLDARSTFWCPVCQPLTLAAKTGT